MFLFKRVQNLLAWMPIAIVQSARDHRPLRSYARQKLRPCRRNAAVMPHFEQSARKILLRQHGLLDGRLRVALQHHRSRAVGQVQHQRIVVRGLGAGLIIAKRRQHVHLCAAEGKRIAGAKAAYPHMQCRRLGQQSVVDRDVRIISHP